MRQFRPAGYRRPEGWHDHTTSPSFHIKMGSGSSFQKGLPVIIPGILSCWLSVGCCAAAGDHPSSRGNFSDISEPDARTPPVAADAAGMDIQCSPDPGNPEPYTAVYLPTRYYDYRSDDESCFIIMSSQVKSWGYATAWRSSGP